MRFLAPASLFVALLASSPALADEPAAAAPPVAAPPAPAPLSSTQPALVPGYVAPYAVYIGAPLPPPWGQPLVTRRHSDAMRTTGIVLFGVGGAASAVGGVIFAAVATTGCALSVDTGTPEGATPTPLAGHERIGSARQALNGCDTSPALGLGIFAAGFATALAGIPLFVIGSKQEPVTSTLGKLLPSATIGAGTGTLRWTF